MPVVGVGIDVVDVARFGEALARTPALREKLGDWRPCRTTRAVATGIPGAKVLCEITAVAPRGRNPS